jgi:hypothetical protein
MIGIVSWWDYTSKLDYGWLFLFWLICSLREVMECRKLVHKACVFSVGNIHRYSIVVGKRSVMKCIERRSISTSDRSIPFCSACL